MTVVAFGMCQKDVDTVLEDPHTMIGSDGIEYVLINGRVVVEGGVQRDIRPDRVLRHSAGQ